MVRAIGGLRSWVRPDAVWRNREWLAHSRTAVYSKGVTEPSYPGAVPPERSRAFEPGGVRLNLLEWGDPQAAPLVLTHGMWDHARSFAVLAPLLAARFRVVAIDARGHEPAPTAPSAGPS